MMKHIKTSSLTPKSLGSDGAFYVTPLRPYLDSVRRNYSPIFMVLRVREAYVGRHACTFYIENG